MEGASMPQERSILAKWMPARIKSVSRAIGYCLLLDDGDAWFSLPPILAVRLSAPERAALAYTALKALNPEDAQNVACAALQPLRDEQQTTTVAEMAS